MVGTNGAVDHTFPDAREFDIRSCCRMFANCSTKTPSNGLVLGNMNVWIPTSSGGSISLVPNYTAESSQLYEFLIPQTTGLRVGLSDRVAAQNSNLMAGEFEMDCTARIRWNRVSADETVPRIGFSAGHITYRPLDDATPAPFYACIAFTCFGSEQTWRAHLSVNGTSYLPGDNGKGPVFYERRIDTGVPIGDWNNLHVWVSRDGKQVEFFANGELVYRETDPEFIPRRDNFVGNVDINEEISVSGNGSTLNNGGFTLRGVQTLPSGAVPVQLDWIRVRYFLKR
jgi:hypothetical protein